MSCQPYRVLSDWIGTYAQSPRMMILNMWFFLDCDYDFSMIIIIIVTNLLI
jgi:hypothetical protein